MATLIDEKLPNDYVGAEWRGDHGVIMVTDDAVESVTKLVNATAENVDVVVSDGVDANPATCIVRIGFANNTERRQREVPEGAKQIVGDEVTIALAQSEGPSCFATVGNSPRAQLGRGPVASLRSGVATAGQVQPGTATSM